MNYEHYTKAVKSLMSLISSSKGLDLELHPFFNAPILAQENLDLGYKVHRASVDPGRIMSLIVSPFAFRDVPGETVDLTPTAVNLITEEIQRFWCTGNSKRHVVVHVVG